MLRPAYNFFGIPTAQLALDYVGHFTQNRECASRLLNKFSLTALKTNMSGVLQGGAADDLEARMAYFVQKQSNDGCFVLDKETEDLVKLETPLAGVTDIVRQSLEFVAAVQHSKSTCKTLDGLLLAKIKSKRNKKIENRIF